MKGLKDFKCSKWDKISQKFVEWDENFNLYFVVPSDIFNTFPWQTYRTSKSDISNKYPQWIDKITQFALEIKLDRKQNWTLKSNDIYQMDTDTVMESIE